MQIWGKVLGFVFGLMLSKTIIGAIIGAWLGHMFDKGRSLDFDSINEEKDVNRQAAFFYTTFSVMGHIAKAKGHVTAHEIAFASAYMDKLALKSDLRQQAQDAFREGKMAGFPLKERLNKFKKSCGARHDLLLMFLEIQIQIAFADGELDSTEREVLHNIAKLLGFSPRDLDRLLEMIIAGAAFHQYQSNQQQSNHGAFSGVNSKEQLNNAYKILGIDKSTPVKDVKKSYKKLMSQHHPDKLIAKGLPPEMMEMAKQKTQDIQAAYDLVSKQFK